MPEVEFYDGNCKSRDLTAHKEEPDDEAPSTPENKPQVLPKEETENTS